MPVLTPFTLTVPTPVLPIVATPVLPLVQVPPPVVSVSVVVLPWQMLAGEGVIGPGVTITVTVFVTKQPEAVVYVILARPALAPVTVPFTTVAAVLLLVHVPPPVASVSTVLVAIQMLTGVEGLMAAGSAFTVTLAVVIHVPIL